MATSPHPTKKLAIVIALIVLLSAASGEAQVLLAPPILSIPKGLSSETRDPFWPVGYAPKSAADLAREKALQNKVIAPKWAEAKATLRVGGYIKTPNGYSALVNNSVVSAKDIVSLIFDGKQYRWKVESVSASGISFVQLDCVSVEAKSTQPGKD